MRSISAGLVLAKTILICGKKKDANGNERGNEWTKKAKNEVGIKKVLGKNIFYS